MVHFHEFALPDRPASDIAEPANATIVQPIKLERGLTIDVAITTPAEPTGSPDIITFEPWSGFVYRDDVGDGQFRALSAGLGGRVIGPDNLGIGENTSRIPRTMYRDLTNGNFRPVIDAQWEAMQIAAPDLSSDLRFFSYSQGATLQAEAIAALPDGHSVHDAIFMETVDFQPQPFALLLARYGREAIKWASYLTPEAIALNTPEWAPKPGSDTSLHWRIIHNLSDYEAYPRALARTRTFGALAEALASGKITPATHLAFVNNSLSTISTTLKNDKFVAKLARSGFKNIDRITVHNESHGMIDNYRAMAAFYELYSKEIAPR